MAYSVEVVNSNYKSALGKLINLSLIHTIIPNSKLYTRPSQLVIKDPEGTIIFFSSGRHRVMGCNDDLIATCLAYKYAAIIDNSDNDFKLVTTQISTVIVLFYKKIH